MACTYWTWVLCNNFSCGHVVKSFSTNQIALSFPHSWTYNGLANSQAGRETSCMWMLPSCTRRVIRARSLLCSRVMTGVSRTNQLVSPLHTGVVSHHARATFPYWDGASYIVIDKSHKGELEITRLSLGLLWNWRHNQIIFQKSCCTS